MEHPTKNFREYPATPVFAADVEIKSCPSCKLLNKQCFTTEYHCKIKKHEIESVQLSLALKRQPHPLWYVTLVNHGSSFNSTDKQLPALPPHVPHMHFVGRKQCDE